VVAAALPQGLPNQAMLVDLAAAQDLALTAVLLPLAALELAVKVLLVVLSMRAHRVVLVVVAQEQRLQT
jgi:hypothetical protein